MLLAEKVIDTLLYKSVTMDQAISLARVPAGLVEKVRTDVCAQVDYCQSCRTWHMLEDMDEDAGVCYGCFIMA